VECEYHGEAQTNQKEVERSTKCLQKTTKGLGDYLANLSGGFVMRDRREIGILNEGSPPKVTSGESENGERSLLPIPCYGSLLVSRSEVLDE
jgi:hypothetical protein